MASVSKYKLNEAEKNRIEGIVARLRNAVDIYNIMRWLENFKDEDRTHALTVLENMTYYNADDIYAILKRHLAYLGIHHRSCKVYMVPIRELGKSGSLVAYYTNKLISRDNREKFLLRTAEDLGQVDVQEKDVLCLMDDFVGTGDTIKKFYKKHKAQFDRFSKRYAFLIGYMPEGQEAMEGLELRLMGNKQEPLFKKRGSVIGYEPRMKVVRNFAYQYGKIISPKNKRTKQHPLGYANSQALVAFDYTTPNNTLPIIWATAKNERIPWYPLFPRRKEDSIKRLSEMRRNYWMWLNANKRLKTPYKIIAEGDAYTIEKVKLFMLIELLHSRRSRSTWEQILGVTSIELEEICSKAKECGFVDEELRLTDNALQLLMEVQKSRRKQTGEDIEIAMINEANRYVPKMFMGDS